jgi:hypothetical protein
MTFLNGLGDRKRWIAQMKLLVASELFFEAGDRRCIEFNFDFE